MHISLSIIICTQSRALSLKSLLVALMQQDIKNKDSIEILIVDNASQDTTADLIQSFKMDSPYLISSLYESQRSLSKSRNRGAAQAQGTYLCFTDDDCVPEENWISSILNAFQQRQCDALGGRVALRVENGALPSWIERNMDIFWGVLSKYDLGTISRTYNASMPPFVGANMAITKACYQELGPFREDLGHGSGAVGEDTEYFNRLLKTDKKIWYNAESYVTHCIPLARLTPLYFIKWHLKKLMFILRTTPWYSLIVVFFRCIIRIFVVGIRVLKAIFFRR